MEGREKGELIGIHILGQHADATTTSMIKEIRNNLIKAEGAKENEKPTHNRFNINFPLAVNHDVSILIILGLTLKLTER